ncbi:conserved hypothetical protein [Candidatus Terasakiella magnetica]|uniref:Uncharacterized protein n=1 Tax=Candidatus Terasakiella magnetica TaxID=1867952 RepID=A0A1C3RGW8_9PROT|nr:hypothetical protein [Candidatus Terasakiella magnetica]SCA56521.1 conserved hypothetical protein [Candidatus Terasakiella magnetica]
MSNVSEITREMGTNHKDFLRLLPRSIPDATINWQGNEQTGAKVNIENAPLGRIDIDLSKVGERRIALLALPVTHVTFRFYDVDQDSAQKEYDRMAKYFQRGGG